MKKLALILLFLVTIACLSCKSESKKLVYSEDYDKFKYYDKYTDEYGNEGVIVYISRYVSSGALAEVIVLSADESEEHWGPMGELVYKAEVESNAVFKTPRFGLGMLQCMKSIGIERFPAQKWCDEKNNGEQYPDAGSWRLPTYEEFKNIFDKGESVGVINRALRKIGGTQVDTNELYWTCVEDFDNYINITSGNTTLNTDYDKENRAVLTSPKNTVYSNKDRWLKKNKYRVRAIKYIYLANS